MVWCRAFKNNYFNLTAALLCTSSTAKVISQKKITIWFHTAARCGPILTFFFFANIQSISDLFFSFYNSLILTNPNFSNPTQVFFIITAESDTYSMVFKVTAVWTIMSHFIQLLRQWAGCGSIHILIILIPPLCSLNLGMPSPTEQKSSCIVFTFFIYYFLNDWESAATYDTNLSTRPYRY